MTALQDVRVLDFTHVLAGPFCTYQLAVLGADVVKIESHHDADMMRDAGPLYGLGQEQMGIHYLSQASNKRSLALDLKAEQSKTILEKLIADADVLVINYRPEPAKKFGLDYEHVSQINPKIVYCSMTGFGQTGPKANDPAYDIVIQAYSGLMAATGSIEGGPTRVGPPVLDYGTGAQAAMAILASLYQRHSTGKGNFIDVAMLDSALMLMTSAVAETGISQSPPTRIGNSSPRAGYGCYGTQDDDIVIGAYTIRQLQALWDTVELPEKSTSIAGMNPLELDRTHLADSDMLNQQLQKKSARHWEEVLNKAGVPAARVRTLNETLGEEQVASRNVVQQIPSPNTAELSDHPQLSVSVSAWGSESGSPTIHSPAPFLGEHSGEVLSEIGLTDVEINQLHEAGVVKLTQRPSQ